jgi:acyl-homoserine lactone acylase PvdQ
LAVTAVITLIFLLIVGLLYLYKEHDSGTVYLKRATSEVSIIREDLTGIAHIKGKSIQDIVYA